MTPFKTKLTAEKAQEIREKYAAGARVQELAHDYGVSRQSIHLIVSGKAWATPTTVALTRRVKRKAVAP